MATSAYEASYKKYFGDRFDKITKNSSDEEVRNLYDKWAADYDKVSIIEWFSFECRKTKTKVITLANHIGHRQYIEPIKTRSNYMWLTQSAEKCMRARHNWLWFYF